MQKPKYSSLPTRFWDKVETGENDCWLWSGNRDNKGYGNFLLNGKTVRVHRISLADWNKSFIFNGIQALHHCDVRNCVNPKHLYAGTHDDNMADMVRRGRQRNGYTAKK